MGDGPRSRRLIDYCPEGALLGGEEILDRFLRWVSDSELSPYPAQEEALLELVTGRHVVLSTPTGSGKSLVALGLHFKALCEGKRSFYTAPIKALVSEKFFALCEEFGPENVGMLTGDASINWGAPIICCTAEVLSNMALRQGEQTDAPYVVMDEFHYYGDRDRGSAWQIPLLELSKTTFLLMSATLGNTAEIEEKLRAFTGREVAHVHSEDRPVPLDFDYRETSLLDTVESLLETGRFPIYIVHFTQRDAADQAQGLTSGKLTNREEKRAIAEAVGQFRFDSPYGKDIQRFISHGIGVHHAGLLPKYRLLVEQLAQRSLLKVICGTDTLGVGVNVPIRTVLFSQLCKFDGEKVGILPVRDFKQIAGRAGRKGFDDEGSVVCQAPEHVIENRRLEAKAAVGGAGKRRKLVKKKPPQRGFVPWDAETFQRLIHSPPETLSSRFAIGHGMVVSVLQRGSEQSLPGSGYRALATLIASSHETPARKQLHLRDAAQRFRSLRQAGVIALEPLAEPEKAGRRAVVAGELQRDFSLHQALSLYLVEAIAALDPSTPDYALDLLSTVEAIQDNPRQILDAQVRRAKGELVAQLKAERVPYEERMEKLEKVTWPRPLSEFIDATFELFRAEHPWVADEAVRPKSIAREMFESYSSFDDYIRLYGAQRVEGLLLRYLSQVYSTLVRSVPEPARTDEVVDIIGFLRAVIARIDSSLVEEWESMVHPSAAPTAEAQPVERPLGIDWRRDRRALESRVRAELHQLVRALSRKDWGEAARVVGSDPDDPWDEGRFASALAPYFEEYEALRFDPDARRNDRTLFRDRAPGLWDVHQVMLDPAGDEMWNVEAVVDLREPPETGAPLVRIRRIGT